ncbi:hypothetical protein C8F04DRAFT_1246852, partial [Mycena alexandri]
AATTRYNTFLPFPSSSLPPPPSFSATTRHHGLKYILGRHHSRIPTLSRPNRRHHTPLDLDTTPERRDSKALSPSHVHYCVCARVCVIIRRHPPLKLIPRSPVSHPSWPYFCLVGLRAWGTAVRIKDSGPPLIAREQLGHRGPFDEPIISTVQRLAAYITFSIQVACSFPVGTHCFILISSTTHRNPQAQKTTGELGHVISGVHLRSLPCYIPLEVLLFWVITYVHARLLLAVACWRVAVLSRP